MAFIDFGNLGFYICLAEELEGEFGVKVSAVWMRFSSVWGLLRSKTNIYILEMREFSAAMICFGLDLEFGVITKTK